ncbi:MAG TPA: peptidase M16 [Chitinophagaceae bacterium]|nr:peptidase M16 [Chitinophagaceae bacterium]
MKKILCLFLSATIVCYGMAQTIDRSKPPKPGKAPSIDLKDPASFTLPNGMTVLVVENHKLPKVSATLYIDRGPVLEGNKGGVMSLMGQMLSEGTKKMPKDKFDEAVDRIGADVSLSSSGGNASALSRYFEQAFLLMAEAVQEPSFPQESFDKLKKQAITALKSGEKNAQTISNRVTNALSYGKHTMLGEFETEETINNIKLEDIRKFYQDYMSPSRSYLTFVGDITAAKAKELATKAFGNWKGKKQNLPNIPAVENVDKTEINFVDLPTAVQGEIKVTNVIYNPMSNPDYHALLIANQILGGGAESKLFMNLREKHGFTYGSYSEVGTGRFMSMFSGSAKVRSEKADSAVAEMILEINNMREGKITEEELATAKALYNGSFALGMENPARAATYASNIMINNLPKDFYRTFLQKINNLTVADIQRVANKYFRSDRSRIVLVGNASKILPNLSRLGYPIKMFDKYANPITDKASETGVKETDKNTEAISAFKLIDDYLKAIGGKEEVKKLNSVKMQMSMEMMGRELEGTDIRMNPNKRYTEMKMGEMKVFQMAFDGSKGYQAQMGQKKEMEEKEIKEQQDDKAIIAQLFYLTPEYQLSYIGTGKAANEDAYKLKVTKPSGKVSVEYYSIKTGLLIREESTSTGPNGEEAMQAVEFTDYKKVGNLLFPFTLTQMAGEMEIVMKIKDIKVNEGVSDADFK